MSRLASAALASIAAGLCSLVLVAQSPAPVATPRARETHAKAEHMVPMRDGTKLYTAVYSPRTCSPGGAPIVLQRTPYGANPYGADAYPRTLGPSPLFQRGGYIVAYQDVRGRHLSEGVWEEVRPHIPDKRGPAFDESSDAYDTIDWLVKHVPCN